MTIKVLLADDADVIRRAVRNVLCEEAEIEIVGEAVTFAETLKLAEQTKPNVVLMDLHMPDTHTIDPNMVKTNLEQCGCKILATSIYCDDEAKALATGLGAFMLLEKPMLGTELVPVLLQIAADAAKRQGIDGPIN